MRRIRLAGRNSRDIVAKAVASCLADLDLPYNWTQKTRELVLGLCLARSAELQRIARTRPEPVRKTERALSEFLAAQRLDLKDGSRKATVRALKRIGLRRFFRYRGKVIVVVDSTTYAKPRSRGKEHRMPHIGKVRLHNLPTRQTLLVPGYTELWTGLLLKDKTCLGITRRLYARSGLSSFRCLTVLNLHTEVMSPGFSQNAIEEGEIERAVSLIGEAFGKGVILVADRGFRRKELLDWLGTDLGVEFVIRISGKLRVRARGWQGLLHQLAPHWPGATAKTLARRQ